jgi:dihydroneopterin triphosphate diphosphatase
MERMPEITVSNVDVYVYKRTDQGLRHLILRRASGRLYGGEWRMVAGKIEKGEQAWQSAIRELWEETGLHPTEFFAIPSDNRFYEWQTDRVRIIPAFAAEVSAEPQLNDEHDTFEWLDALAAAGRLTWPEQQRLLGMVEAMVSVGTVPEALRIPV